MKNKHGVAWILFLASSWITGSGESRPVPLEQPGLEMLIASPWLLGDPGGDGVPDVIRARVVIPPGGQHWQVAAAVLERLGFESAGLDFHLVQEDGKFVPAKDIFPVIAGRNNRWLPAAGLTGAPPGIRELPSWAVLRVGRLDVPGGNAVPALFIAGSDAAAENQAARAFFGRWPYPWEIWGRKNGITFERICAEAAAFFRQHGLTVCNVRTDEAWYEGNPEKSLLEVEAANLSKEMPGYVWETGEVRRLGLRVELASGQGERAAALLARLKENRSRGEDTMLLNYPGVAELEFFLQEGNGGREPVMTSVLLPRYSEPARFLNRRWQNLQYPRIKNPLWLENLYSPAGFYEDNDQDRIPDGLALHVLPDRTGWSAEVCQLGARIAMETGGVHFPVLMDENAAPELDRAGSFLLVGADSRPARQLEGSGVALALPSAENSGREIAAGILAVNRPGGMAPQVLITGRNREAVARAAGWLARDYPYAGRFRQEEAALPALQEEIKQILAGRTPEATLAWLLTGRRGTLEVLSRMPGLKLKCKAVLDLPASEDMTRIQPILRAQLPPGAELGVVNRRDPKEVFKIAKELPWEGDLVREGLQRYLAGHPAGADWQLDVRVSEEAPVRATLRRQLEELLRQHGGGAQSSVRVYSAYKQGFSWLTEEVLPELKQRGARRVEVAFPSLLEKRNQPRKVYNERSRWMQELYPVDEVLARQLDIPVTAIGFREYDPEQAAPAYRVTAWDARGREVLAAGFEPLYTVQPFFKRFPSWGESPVADAGFQVWQGGRKIYEEKIPTDLARVWGVYQDEVLPELEKHVMKKTGSWPLPEKQPFFQRLVMDLAASEPDSRIGLDEEHISALESIHEDFYFLTLEYLNQLLIKDKTPSRDSVHYVQTGAVAAPGNVLPLVRPGPAGKGPVVAFTLEVPVADNPELELEYQTPEGFTHLEKSKLEALGAAVVHASALYLAEEEALFGVRWRLELKTDEEYERFVKFFRTWRELLAAGAARPAASAGLGYLQFEAVAPGQQGIFHLPLAEQPLPAASPASGRGGAIPVIAGGEIVCPEECIDLIKGFSGQPGFTVFKAGQSYEGRPVYAAEVLSPSPAELISRTKLLLQKPTLMLTGRQHANEVASTTYLLKLMEEIARGSSWDAYRQKVNLVIQPMENVDGAATACRLKELTPYHALHAGRFSSLGVDVGYETGKPDTLITEALVRDRLYGRWLPDIYLNLHGYPSHEWVQQFSGYTPYLFRQYWIPKGWFAYLRYDETGLEPEYLKAAGTLLDYLRDAYESDPRLKAFNQMHYGRYHRWGVRWSPHLQYLDLVGQTNIYASRRSGTAVRLNARSRMTFAEGIPELMDETAHGSFLEFLSVQGFAYLKAHLDYLSGADPGVVRVEQESGSRTIFQFFRKRPIIPAGGPGQAKNLSR